MTSIEDKIQLFTKLTYDKIQEEKKQESEEFERYKRDILKKEESKLSAMGKKEISEASKKADLKANELISKAKNKNHQDILNLKEKLVDEVYEDVMRKLKEFTKGNEYKNILMSMIKLTVQGLDKKNYKLYLTQGDYDNYSSDIKELLKGYKDIEIELSITKENIIGGVVLEDNDKKVRINNSLCAKLEDNIGEIGLKVTENMES